MFSPFPKKETEPTFEYTVIGAIMRLGHEYDIRQLWLPFVQAIIKTFIPEPKSSPLATYAVLAMAQKPYATLHRTDPARNLYIYEKGVEQLALPFVEGKNVSDADWTELTKNEFPGWEKTPLGYLPRLKVPATKEATEWLMDNCRGRFRHKSKVARFEFMTDFAMATLRFT
jgi:hypothetical protein